MKSAIVVLVGAALLGLAGCASEPSTPDSPVLVGMSQNDLLLRFGEPLRIEKDAAGGQNWYYNFSWWETHPTGVAESHEEFGDKTSSVSVGLNFSRGTHEQAIHLAPDGYVTEPLPRGKPVKNKSRE